MRKQRFQNVICQSLMAASLVLSSSSASALSIDWSGNYRFEYTEVDRTSVGDPKLRKAYVLNHLSLSPKIIAADGVNIVGKLEFLPNDQYPDSQVGQTFGKGPTPRSAAGSSTKDDSAVAGDRHGYSNLKVSQLYLNINQEYGSFVAGRAPLEFGMGITHNAGNGMFDHWGDTRDMVSYKFIIGNFSFQPMLAKVYDYSVAQGREAQDLIWDVQYNNPETESAIGLMHQTRNASKEANDAPFAAYGATSVADRWNTQTVSLFLSRGFEDVKFKVEAGFESGPTGLVRANGEEMKLNGYGIALDIEVPRPQSKVHWNFRAGMASGDNPDTTNYEGFHFDRNYDVAFLLFNHPLGQYDLLRSFVQRGPDRLNNLATPYATDEALDDETISNAVYVSPRAVYNISDKWDWTNTITWAQLQTNPVGGGVDVSKDLGFEWDTGLTFRPHERITWVNEFGFLFPGAAWSGSPGQNFGKAFTYGFNSKAAISF
ncbi:MAG: hypothetical protein ACXWC9_02955 [Pseudobdellovibrionaceae bacterium]